MTDPPAVRFMNAPDLAATPGYSHAAEVRGGRTVYLSGQIAVNIRPAETGA